MSPIKLQRDFHVRWNTTYLMLRKFLEYKKVIKRMFKKHRGGIEGMSEEQHKLMDSIALNEARIFLIIQVQNTIPKHLICLL